MRRGQAALGAAMAGGAGSGCDERFLCETDINVRSVGVFVSRVRPTLVGVHIVITAGRCRWEMILWRI